MNFPKSFIRASAEYSDYEKHISAPYFRKNFEIENEFISSRILICGLGFYRLYINGVDVTKGFLAPYISNPDDIIYYDEYDITNYLKKGKNTVGVCLGNGFVNNPGGHVWGFHEAKFRSAPLVAFSIEVECSNGEKLEFTSDEKCKTTASPIYFDDYRCGEYYDARNEIPDWNMPDFDDSNWAYAEIAPVPGGETKLCEAEPIVAAEELEPVLIQELEDGFMYDFGKNGSGICRLKINGEKGQKISLYHAERLVNGVPDMVNISFPQKTPVQHDYVQKSIYICKGEETEIHTPDFVYNGFRYVLVKGITKEQATSELITYVVIHSDVKERGGFKCSDEMANKLQEITRRSDVTNLHYFPTDCPQREKNGWTADAALSAEHMLLNLSVENIYSEWLNNIRKAQRIDGALPGIVPTPGWGFDWGNGPAWDSVLIYLPYFTYIYRGDKKILEDNATSIFRYLDYITKKRDDKGLVAIGLGDWCPVGKGAADYDAPLELTDSVVCIDICDKAAFIFETLGLSLQQKFAMDLSSSFKKSVRENLIDFQSMTVAGNCQTSQAISIFYNVFEENEKPAAFNKLMELVKNADDHMTTGVIGGRVLFHVLSEFGESDLAYKMITRKDYPSYGNWIERGATTLWEEFKPEGGPVSSLNHHFWGDISHWFIRWVAGIHFNPERNNINRVDIKPSFITCLDNAEGYYYAPAGEIKTFWQRLDNNVYLDVSVPEVMVGQIILPDGYSFENGSNESALFTGTFSIKIS